MLADANLVEAAVLLERHFLGPTLGRPTIEASCQDPTSKPRRFETDPKGSEILVHSLDTFWRHKARKVKLSWKPGNET